MESETNCVNCKEEFNNERVKLVSPVCFHKICKGCVKGMIDVVRFPQYMRCPSCQKAIDWDFYYLPEWETFLKTYEDEEKEKKQHTPIGLVDNDDPFLKEEAAAGEPGQESKEIKTV